MRPIADPGSGMSSGLPRASSSPRARTATPTPAATWPVSWPASTGSGCGAYAGMRALQVWYAAIPIETIIERVERARSQRAGLDISIEEARRRDHLPRPRQAARSSNPAEAGSSATGRLSCCGCPRRSRAGQPAGPLRELPPRSLAPDRRLLVEKHRLLDVALKVVGVGSVGTRCYVALFAGPAGGPLVLQVKEARGRCSLRTSAAAASATRASAS